jgi:formiminotetrahydrofolate cyclodeaminase
MIKDEKIGEFLENVASPAPTPGGGSVAALMGAAAAALVEMVWGLTKGGEPGRSERIKEVRELREKLLELVDKDSEAFNFVMSAYKSSDKEKIKSSLAEAIRIPSETKGFAGRVEELAEEVSKKGNQNAVSDAKSAIYLAQAAQRSAQENIDINKKALEKLDA